MGFFKQGLLHTFWSPHEQALEYQTEYTSIRLIVKFNIFWVSKWTGIQLNFCCSMMKKYKTKHFFFFVGKLFKCSRILWSDQLNCKGNIAHFLADAGPFFQLCTQQEHSCWSCLYRWHHYPRWLAHWEGLCFEHLCALGGGESTSKIPLFLHLQRGTGKEHRGFSRQHNPCYRSIWTPAKITYKLRNWSR